MIQLYAGARRRSTYRTVRAPSKPVGPPTACSPDRLVKRIPPSPRHTGNVIGRSTRSPDGHELAFISTTRREQHGWWSRVFPAQPVGTADPIASTSWSANGAWIAYNTHSPRKIALVNLTSQTPSFLTIPDSLSTQYQPSMLVLDARHILVGTIRKWTDW